MVWLRVSECSDSWVSEFQVSDKTDMEDKPIKKSVLKRFFILPRINIVRYKYHIYEILAIPYIFSCKSQVLKLSPLFHTVLLYWGYMDIY